MNSRVLAIVGPALGVLILQAHAYAGGGRSNSGLARSVLSEAEIGLHPSGPGAVIRVADPTGDPETDRANIEDAVARARPGDTVLFAKGRYVTVIEGDPAGICVPLPDITLLGSAEGTTTLFGTRESSFGEGPDGIVFSKGGGTVRRLTFESYAFAINLGLDCGGNPGGAFGGYLIADNVFKNLLIPVAGDLNSSNSTRITRNLFINTVDMFVIVSHVVHVTDNTYRIPNSEAIPSLLRPFDAGLLLGFAGLECNDNVIENNIVEGNVDGFQLVAADGACRRNVIRKNRVSINQALIQEGDRGTLVGMFSAGAGAPLANNLVEGNFLDGSMGIGIDLFRVTNSTFQGNVIRGVRRSPFFGGFGGVAILLHDGSQGNAVASNRMEDNEFCDVFLRRNTANNVVVEPNDRVLDRGLRNQVLSRSSCGPDASVLEAEALEEQVAIPEKIETMLDEVKRYKR